MKLNHGLHLAYCTNIHRGETWEETFDALKRYTLPVRDRVSPSQPYAIGLRLSQRAATELSDRTTLVDFQRWLGQNHCYVFTNLLFDLLAQLVPPGIDGSVSTLPGSFKEYVRDAAEAGEIRRNLWHCVEHIARVSAQTGRTLHLGLEPEPLCFLECSGEVIHFFDRLRAERKNDPRLDQHLGVNYDTCHFAVEFEEPQHAIAALRQHRIKISKFHLSSALKVVSTPEVRAALKAFADDTYLHQVVVRRADGGRVIYRDLSDALASEPTVSNEDTAAAASEWRIHFHIPLHSPPNAIFDTTADHITGVLDLLQAEPSMCSHLEMETYTWEVLPAELKARDVVSQLVAEYEWTLARLAERNLYG